MDVGKEVKVGWNVFREIGAFVTRAMGVGGIGNGALVGGIVNGAAVVAASGTFVGVILIGTVVIVIGAPVGALLVGTFVAVMGARVGAVLEGALVAALGACVGALLEGANVVATGDIVGAFVTRAIDGFCVNVTLGELVGCVVGEIVSVSQDAGGLSDKSHIPLWIQLSKALTLV
jgi:hypothetical protein